MPALASYLEVPWFHQIYFDPFGRFSPSREVILDINCTSIVRNDSSIQLNFPLLVVARLDSFSQLLACSE